MVHLLKRVRTLWCFGLVFLTACSVSQPSPPTQLYGAEQKIPFIAQDPCVLAGDSYRVLSRCETEALPVEPGHYTISIEARAENLEAALNDSLNIEVSQYDSAGNQIPIEVPYRGKVMYGEQLEGVFLEPVRGEDLESKQFRRITLIHRHYPGDTGWIAPNVVSIRLRFLYNGSGSLWLRNLTVQRSKWNYPFSERDECLPVSRPPNSVPPKLAVLSQGSVAAQSKWLLPALKKKIADVYVLELGPANFVGSEVTPETRALVGLLKSNSADWGIAYNPYWEREDQQGPGSFQISSPGAVAGARERISWFVNNGASLVMLRADDLVPVGEGPFSYQLRSRADVRRFGDLATAHLFLAQALLGDLPRTVRTYFVPPWYNSFFVRNYPEQAQNYLLRIGRTMARETGIIWTGPLVRSLSIDAHEVNAYHRLVAGHALSLWDNTIYARRHKDFWLARPERAPLMSLLEPYSVELPPDYLFEGRAGEDLLLINGQIDPFSQIQVLSAGEYVRSVKHYCPERVVRKVLEQQIGFDDMELLIERDGRYAVECLGRTDISESCSALMKSMEELLR